MKVPAHIVTRTVCKSKFDRRTLERGRIAPSMLVDAVDGAPPSSWSRRPGATVPSRRLSFGTTHVDATSAQPHAEEERNPEGDLMSSLPTQDARADAEDGAGADLILHRTCSVTIRLADDLYCAGGGGDADVHLSMRPRKIVTCASTI